MPNPILHLIPNILASDNIEVIPCYYSKLLREISYFFVEEIKSARRFLKKLNKDIVIDDLHFFMLNEHENDSLKEAERLMKEGQTIAYISEAGCPGVADPGQELVALAHRYNIIVKPHVGPNSILLALMASGFNGQQFYFHGYLPNKQPMLTQKIKEIEQESRLRNCSQLFIETPYRNQQLLAELTKSCHPATQLCIAANLTSADERIYTKSIREWKLTELNFHKVPAVFVLYAC